MRISDWSSDVCSSDLSARVHSDEMPVRLSSRDLFPGPNAVATHRFVDRQLSALAAGEDASLVRPRHALMAMGPGAKPRGDSGVREALREPDRDAGQEDRKRTRLNSSH